MAAAARAAARRQAILSSRGDRLAKLTSSARGDDPGATHDDPPLPTINPGIKDVPSPSYPSTSSHAPSTDAARDESQNPDWNSRQHQELLRALMDGMGGTAGQPGPQPTFGLKGLPPGFPPIAGTIPNASAPAAEDPFSTLLTSLGGQDNSSFATAAPPPRTLFQKLIPVLHVLSMIALVIWFVTWREPEEFSNALVSTILRSDDAGSKFLEGYATKGVGWKRWASLASGPTSIAGLTIPPLPTFFWAFTTIELLLHSLRLFYEPNVRRPPMLLNLVLPYLPPPFPKVILASLNWFQMASLVLDDLAVLVFGIGLVVFVSNWMSRLAM